MALGLFEKSWTPENGIRRFKQLATEAFTKRRGLNIPIIGKVSEPFCTFKYRSAGIVGALHKAFGDDYLFGQGVSDTNSRDDLVKVGVVACQEGSSGLP